MNKLLDDLSTPRTLFIIMTVLSAIVFVLMIVVLTFGVSNFELRGEVRALKHNHDVTAQAAYKACVKNRPGNVKFIKALILILERQRSISYRVLQKTDIESPLFKIRIDTFQNFDEGVKAIKKFIPIKCALPRER